MRVCDEIEFDALALAQKPVSAGKSVGMGENGAEVHPDVFTVLRANPAEAFLVPPFFHDAFHHRSPPTSAEQVVTVHDEKPVYTHV